MTNPPKPKVLVVDDSPANIDVLIEALGTAYEISVAVDGASAIDTVKNNKPDIILLDIIMPGLDGYQVCEILKNDERTKSIPIIFLTAMTTDDDEAKGLAVGAVDYITKPFNHELVKARIRNHLELKQHRDHLEELVKERTEQLELNQAATIESLSALAEYRDPETGGHIKRTQNYIRLLCDDLKPKKNLEESVIDLFCRSAPLHDIGKVGIADNILLKPGKLTSQEFKEMKKHTIYGRDVLLSAEKKVGGTSYLRCAAEIAISHHEKWDGTGYPYGLKGSEIPFFGRLMALADVYDALISKRVYKPPYSHFKAVDIITNGRNSQFDPEAVDSFLTLEEKFRQTALNFADYEEERIVLSGSAIK